MSCFCDREAREAKRRSKQIGLQLKEERKEFRMTHRFLLFDNESDDTMFIKRMKVLDENSFSKEERLQYVSDIRANIREVIETVTSHMDTLDPPIALEKLENIPRLQYIMEEVLVLPESQTHFPLVFYEHCDALWQDKGVQQCFAKSNEYQLIDSAEYFMDHSKLLEVAREEYLPSDDDILRARKMTRGIYELRFVIERVHFHISSIGIQRVIASKEIQCFQDVTAIIFVVDCSSYHLRGRENNKTSQLKESLALFESIWNHRWLKTVSIMLFLNKIDILEKMVEENIFPIEDYFPEFSFYHPPQPEPTENFNFEAVALRKAKYFFRDLFLRISAKSCDGRHFCYTHFTTSDDTENIRRVVETSKDIFQRMHLQRHNLL